ncbi:hypothetical protein BH10CYA1_BH10CYA1_59810 [soil metagenome]
MEKTTTVVPEKYLKSHLDLVEKTLLCRSSVAASSGHSIHKGALRENFVKEFVVGHIGEDVGVSSGEIFDSERVIGDKANQIDVIIYRRDFPKIRIVSDDINAFMCESVHATIEVKSTLDFKELDTTYKVAARIGNMNSEYFKANNWRIWSYLVAYDATASLETVANWLVRSATNLGDFALPHALCGVFVLGKGFVVSPSVGLFMKDRTSNLIEPLAGNTDWLFVKQESGNLYALFFLLNFLRYGINIRQYFRGVLPEYTIVQAIRIEN